MPWIIVFTFCSWYFDDNEHTRTLPPYKTERNPKHNTNRFISCFWTHFNNKYCGAMRCRGVCVCVVSFKFKFIIHSKWKSRENCLGKPACAYNNRKHNKMMRLPWIVELIRCHKLNLTCLILLHRIVYQPCTYLCSFNDSDDPYLCDNQSKLFPRINSSK